MESTVAAVAGNGFEGAVAGLTLPDLIQLKGLSRFSGCLAVSCGPETGRVFFRDGDVIHAEQGKLSGEEAFYRIVTWPEGNFRTEPTVTTTFHTIRTSASFLLLEAHRLLDEAGGLPAAALPAPRPATDIMSMLNDVVGLDYCVVSAKDGTAVGDASAEGESLAAVGSYAAVIARKIGTLMGHNNLLSVSIRGEEKSILLLDGKNRILTVALAADMRLDAAEAEIRRRLKRPKEQQ